MVIFLAEIRTELHNQKQLKRIKRFDLNGFLNYKSSDYRSFYMRV